MSVVHEGSSGEILLSCFPPSSLTRLDSSHLCLLSIIWLLLGLLSIGIKFYNEWTVKLTLVLFPTMPPMLFSPNSLIWLDSSLFLNLLLGYCMDSHLTGMEFYIEWVAWLILKLFFNYLKSMGLSLGYHT